MRDIGWDGARFVDLESQPINVLFKLYPWEWMVREEFAENELHRFIQDLRNHLRACVPHHTPMASLHALLRPMEDRVSLDAGCGGCHC